MRSAPNSKRNNDRRGHRETHEFLDLVVALSLGVKVASSLPTSHVETGKGVLEDLLESEAVRAEEQAEKKGRLHW